MDAEAIPELLTSRQINLDIDGSASQLGSQPPREITDRDRQQFHSQDFLNWGVRGDIVSLHPGSYDGRPASLIVLELGFKFPTEVGNNSRFREAIVAVTFEPHCPNGKNSGKNSTDFPVVRIVSPKAILGPVRTAKMSSESGLRAAVGVPEVIPVKAELEISQTQGVEFVRDHRMEIKGRLWSSKGSPVKNMARWTMVENSALGVGIPTEFRAGIVVEHHGQPIRGTIKIDAKTKRGLSLFGWPWSDSYPIILKPGVGFRKPLEVDDFSQLTKDDWKELCAFDDDDAVTCKWI